MLGREAGTILAELDAPRVETPGLWRRGWRRFRRIPRWLQLAIAALLFAFWAFLLWTALFGHTPSPSRPPGPGNGVNVSGVPRLAA